VAQGEGKAEKLVCPYHGWTYALDGRLLRAPELGAVKGFARAEFGLIPMAVTEWGSLVFVSISNAPRSLTANLAPLLGRLEAMQLQDLVFTARRVYTLACNWKVFIDNYLDGGYHLAALHQGLAAQLDLATYRTELFEGCSIQSAKGARSPGEESVGSDFSERIGDDVVYAWIHPNLMINRYGNMMDVNWTLPLSSNRTRVVIDYYFFDAQRRDAELVERSIAASDVVQREDADICESVQRGLASRTFDRGRYSVKREGAALHFHRLLATDLRSDL
jgi:choline monooxygenase